METDDKAEPPRRGSRTRHSNEIRHSKASIWTQEEDFRLLSIMSDPAICGNKWTEIAKLFPNKLPKQVSERWRNVLNPKIRKGTWTPEEDSFIIQWVKEQGTKNWEKCAAQIGNRTGKQCRERWVNQLSNSNRKWTFEEDEQLIKLMETYGKKWKVIAGEIGRSENQVKNRWHSTLRRRIERTPNVHEPLMESPKGKKKQSLNPNEIVDVKNLMNNHSK